MVTSLLATNRELRTAIHDWQRLCGVQVERIEQLDGLSNKTFRVGFAGNHTVIIRINGSSEHLGVDRERELNVLKAAQGIAPSLLHKTEDFWIFEYIEQIGTATWVDIAISLNQVHSLEFSITPTWTPNDTIEDYLKLLPELKPDLLDIQTRLRQTPWGDTSYGLCHIDLNPGNIIMTRQGVRLIDWEYARYGPIAYDLAVLFRTHNASRSDVDQFFDHYDLNLDRNLLSAAKISFDVIELLWLGITDRKNWSLTRVKARVLDLKRECEIHISP